MYCILSESKFFAGNATYDESIFMLNVSIISLIKSI